MKNKILIGIVILLILVVVFVRYQFKTKFDVFKSSVSQYENTEMENFRKEKESRVALLSKGDYSIYQSFTSQFDERKSISESDTTFSYLYLSESIKYKVPLVKYIDCLNSKCLIDKQNEANQILINKRETALQNKFGEIFSQWYPKLKDKILPNKTTGTSDCIDFFPDFHEVSYDIAIWNDLEKFLTAYTAELKESQIENKQIDNQYNSTVATTKSQLRSSVISYFDSELSDRSSQILTSSNEEKTYNFLALGVITYTLNKRTFDKQAFQNVADDALEEQWKTNSLNTGAMPYASCYGSNNSCEYGCSKISVRTGGSDVLVTIKDVTGDVVRHGYVSGGETFTFNVPDGEYQVFFYSGSGWNPQKIMKTNSCGTLRGGFVSGESFTKDNFVTLYSQGVTYELILQPNGNLNTEPSSMDEAFK